MHCMPKISFFVRKSFHGINPPIRTKCKLALQTKTIDCKAYWMRIKQLTTTANISWCLHFYWFPCEMISWEQAQRFHTDYIWGVLVIGRATIETLEFLEFLCRSFDLRRHFMENHCYNWVAKFRLFSYRLKEWRLAFKSYIVIIYY